MVYLCLNYAKDFYKDCNVRGCVDKISCEILNLVYTERKKPPRRIKKYLFDRGYHPIDDLSRFVLILLRMRMQEFSAGNKNITNSQGKPTIAVHIPQLRYMIKLLS